MNAANDKLIKTFETRVRQLILQYKELKEENEELYAMVDEKDTIIKDLNTDIERLKADYANLKLAKMIEIHDDEIKSAKSRINKLVREIDKSIALLNI